MSDKKTDREAEIADRIYSLVSELSLIEAVGMLEWVKNQILHEVKGDES